MTGIPWDFKEKGINAVQDMFEVRKA